MITILSIEIKWIPPTNYQNFMEWKYIKSKHSGIKAAFASNIISLPELVITWSTWQVANVEQDIFYLLEQRISAPVFFLWGFCCSGLSFLCTVLYTVCLLFVLHAMLLTWSFDWVVISNAYRMIHNNAFSR